MSALTERRKKEIDAQYRELISKRAQKVFATVFCVIKNSMTPQLIMCSIKRMGGIESISYTTGSNVITFVARWKRSEAAIKIKKIRRIPSVTNVQADVLAPLF